VLHNLRPESSTIATIIITQHLAQPVLRASRAESSRVVVVVMNSLPRKGNDATKTQLLPLLKAFAVLHSLLRRG